MKLYGIANCDTVKKARAWLAAQRLDISFHDFRKNGLDEATLKKWMEQVGWEKLLNRKGTTWRQLTEDTRLSITGEAAALALMLEKTSLIKRPVLEFDGVLQVGFDEAAYRALFGIDAQPS
ncbi:MAG: ArsC family reductase [Sulfuricellaceae bacterium]|nr:ArsC family reductase [Sulfuricellaceae bacterium]